MTGTPTITRLAEADLDDVVEVLADSFARYPVMRHVLQGSADYAKDLPVLLRLFASSRLLRGEPVLGAVLGDTLEGVALVSFPELASPPALSDLRTGVWNALGSDAKGRYEKFGETTAVFFEGLSRTHLNMIGVRGRTQGSGVGRALLEAAAQLALGRPDTDGVTLTTEVPANVELYRKFGYEVIGHVTVASDLETWGMLKRNRT